MDPDLGEVPRSNRGLACFDLLGDILTIVICSQWYKQGYTGAVV